MGLRILSTGIDGPAIMTLLDRKGLLSGEGDKVRDAVSAIIKRVRDEGDSALFDYTRTLDGAEIGLHGLRLTGGEITAGADATDPVLRRAIDTAARNIRRFHEHQCPRDLLQLDESGSLLGLRFVPVARVGVYVPGGTGGATPLISSALMGIIPAQVAGVPSIVVCSPPRADGSLIPGLLYALALLGVDEVYRIGGAQAVAALAYGTGSIVPVDKIVGPGSQYVTEAKRQVYGLVGIDLLAGPSEVAVIADEAADPRYIAADLVAQAEHGPGCGAFLLTPSLPLAEAVGREIENDLAKLTRGQVILENLSRYGGAVITRDLDEALALSEQLAPEHLELLVAEPLALAGRVRNAGAVFLGPYSPEALGDYVAGTNHVLPTNGTARFGSGLGVDDFLRRISLVSYTRQGFAADAPHGIRMAEAEGLTAHALSLAVRREEGDAS